MPLLRVQGSGKAIDIAHMGVRGMQKDIHSQDKDCAGEMPDPIKQSPAASVESELAPDRRFPKVGNLTASGGELEKAPQTPEMNFGKIVIPECYRDDALPHLIESCLEGRTLKEICAEENMPHIGVVRRWLSQDLEFRNAYISAQKLSALTEIEEIKDIADNGDDVARDKLRIDARKLRAERLLPEVFGAKKGDGAAGALV